MTVRANARRARTRPSTMSRAMITTSGASSTGRLLATLIVSAAIVGTLSHEVASGTGTERGATYSSNFTMHSTHLRSHLLSGYDRHVPPTSDRSLLGVEYSSAGTDVEVQIRFFKVESVRASHGDMKLKIWMRTYHSDLRLSWNPEDYGGLEYVDFWVDPAPSGSGTEIWIPDVQPYNALHGIAHTLDPINAIVWSSGRVFISRPGSLEVMCKFSGLVAFPFDELGCKIGQSI